MQGGGSLYRHAMLMQERKIFALSCIFTVKNKCSLNQAYLQKRNILPLKCSLCPIAGSGRGHFPAIFIIKQLGVNMRIE